MDAQEVVSRLRKETNHSVTIQQYEDWMNYHADVKESASKFDAAVRAYLGEKLFRKADATAKVYDVMIGKMKGKTSFTLGGRFVDLRGEYVSLNDIYLAKKKIR